ncbi:hypothetical protein [Streptomyces sp. NPDC048350]|uniref:hypothetical protein n=1 Tax=Streptomyces sp. NPDC048350 TaxID=3365538 RepID=UPI003721A084
MAGQLECGGFVYDPAARKVGEYRGEAGPYAMLRPVGGGRCVDCAELAARRTAARARFDWSAETDANVLLRRHRGERHAPDDPPVTSMSP